MSRKRSLERASRWERFLRRLRGFLLWWWKAYLGLVIVGALAGIWDAFRQYGLDALSHFLDQNSFIVQVARAYPIAFWSVFGALTALALADLGLDLMERWREGGEPGKLRLQYLIPLLSCWGMMRRRDRVNRDE